MLTFFDEFSKDIYTGKSILFVETETMGFDTVSAPEEGKQWDTVVEMEREARALLMGYIHTMTEYENNLKVRQKDTEKIAVLRREKDNFMQEQNQKLTDFIKEVIAHGPKYAHAFFEVTEYIYNKGADIHPKNNEIKQMYKSIQETFSKAGIAVVHNTSAWQEIHETVSDIEKEYTELKSLNRQILLGIIQQNLGDLEREVATIDSVSLPPLQELPEVPYAVASVKNDYDATTTQDKQVIAKKYPELFTLLSDIASAKTTESCTQAVENMKALDAPTLNLIRDAVKLGKISVDGENLVLHNGFKNALSDNMGGYVETVIQQRIDDIANGKNHDSPEDIAFLQFWYNVKLLNQAANGFIGIDGKLGKEREKAETNRILEALKLTTILHEIMNALDVVPADDRTKRRTVVVEFCKVYHKITKLETKYSEGITKQVYLDFFQALVTQQQNPTATIEVMYKPKVNEDREDKKKEDKNKQFSHQKLFTDTLGAPNMFGTLTTSPEIKTIPIKERVDYTRQAVLIQYVEQYNKRVKVHNQEEKERIEKIQAEYADAIKAEEEQLTGHQEKHASKKEQFVKILGNYDKAVKTTEESITYSRDGISRKTVSQSFDIERRKQTSNEHVTNIKENAEATKDIKKQQIKLSMLAYERNNKLGRSQEKKEDFLFRMALRVHPADCLPTGTGLFDDASTELQKHGIAFGYNLKRDLHGYTMKTLMQMKKEMEMKKKSRTEKDFFQGDDSLGTKFFKELFAKDERRAVQTIFLLYSAWTNLLPNGQNLRKRFRDGGIYNAVKGQAYTTSKHKEIKRYLDAQHGGLDTETIEKTLMLSSSHLIGDSVDLLSAKMMELRILFGTYRDIGTREAWIRTEAQSLAKKDIRPLRISIQQKLATGEFEKLGVNAEFIESIKAACKELEKLEIVIMKREHPAARMAKDILPKLIGILGAVFAVQSGGSSVGIAGILQSAVLGTAGYEAASGGTQLLINSLTESFGGLITEGERTLLEDVRSKQISVDEFLLRLNTKMVSGTAQTAFFMGLGRFASVGKQYLKKDSLLYTIIDKAETVNHYISNYMPKGRQRKFSAFGEAALEEIRQEGFGIGLERALEETPLAALGNLASVMFSMSRVHIDLDKAIDGGRGNIILGNMDITKEDGKRVVDQTYLYNQAPGPDANLIKNFINQCDKVGDVFLDQETGRTVIEIEKQGVINRYTIQGFDAPTGTLGLNAVFGDVIENGIMKDDGTYSLGGISSLELEERIAQLRAHYIVNDDQKGTLRLYDGVNKTIEVKYAIDNESGLLEKYPGLAVLMSKEEEGYKIFEYKDTEHLTLTKLTAYLPLAGVDITNLELCSRIDDITFSKGNNGLSITVMGVENTNHDFIYRVRLEEGKRVYIAYIETASANGFGTDLVTLTIQSARAQGYPEVTVYAMSSDENDTSGDKQVGYYFFARLGFQPDSQIHVKNAIKKRKSSLETKGYTDKDKSDVAYIEKSLEENATGSTLLTLMSTHTGRNIRRTYGESYAGVLYLKNPNKEPQQKSLPHITLQTLDAYFEKRQALKKIKEFRNLTPPTATASAQEKERYAKTLQAYGGKTFDELMNTPIEDRPPQTKAMQERIMSLSDADMDVRMQVAEIVLGKNRGAIAADSPERIAIEEAHLNGTTHGTIRILLESGIFSKQEINALTDRGVCGTYESVSQKNVLDITMLQILYPATDKEQLQKKEYAYARKILKTERFSTFYDSVKNFPLEALQSRVMVDMIISSQTDLFPGIGKNEGEVLDFSGLIDDPHRVSMKQYTQHESSYTKRPNTTLKERHDVSYFSSKNFTERPSVINRMMSYTSGYYDHVGTCTDFIKNMKKSLILPERTTRYTDPKGMLVAYGSQMVYVKEVGEYTGLAYNHDSHKWDQVVVFDDRSQSTLRALLQDIAFKRSSGIWVSADQLKKERQNLAKKISGNPGGYDGVAGAEVTEQGLLVVHLDPSLPASYREYPLDTFKEDTNRTSADKIEELNNLFENATPILNSLTTSPEFILRRLESNKKLTVDSSLSTLTAQEKMNYLRLAGIDTHHADIKQQLASVRIAPIQGDPSQIVVDVQGTVDGQISSPKTFSYTITVNKEAGEVEVSGTNFTKYKNEYPTGTLSLSNFITQTVQTAKNLGFTRIVARGSSNSGEVGYYALPRNGFGLDTSEMTYKEFKQELKSTYGSALPPHITKLFENKVIKDPLLQLISTEEGRLFWFQNGFNVSVEIQLDEKEESYQRHRDYAKEKAIVSPVGKTRTNEQFQKDIVERIQTNRLTPPPNTTMALALSPDSHTNLLEDPTVSEQDKVMIRKIQALTDAERYHVATLLLKNILKVDLEDIPLNDVTYGTSWLEVLTLAHNTKSNVITGLILRRSGLPEEHTRLLMRLGVCGRGDTLERSVGEFSTILNAFWDNPQSYTAAQCKLDIKKLLAQYVASAPKTTLSEQEATERTLIPLKELENVFIQRYRTNNPTRNIPDTITTIDALLKHMAETPSIPDMITQLEHREGDHTHLKNFVILPPDYISLQEGSSIGGETKEHTGYNKLGLIKEGIESIGLDWKKDVITFTGILEKNSIQGQSYTTLYIPSKSITIFVNNEYSETYVYPGYIAPEGFCTQGKIFLRDIPPVDIIKFNNNEPSYLWNQISSIINNMRKIPEQKDIARQVKIYKDFKKKPDRYINRLISKDFVNYIKPKFLEQFPSITNLLKLLSKDRLKTRIANKSVLQIFTQLKGSPKTKEGEYFNPLNTKDWIEFCQLAAERIYEKEAVDQLNENLIKTEPENIKNAIKLQFHSIIAIYELTTKEKRQLRIEDKSFGQIFTMLNGNSRTKKGSVFHPMSTQHWIEFCQLVAKNVYGPEAEVELHEHLKKVAPEFLKKAGPEDLKNAIIKRFPDIVNLFEFSSTNRSKIRIEDNSFFEIFTQLKGSPNANGGEHFNPMNTKDWIEFCQLVAERIYGIDSLNKLNQYLTNIEEKRKLEIENTKSAIKKQFISIITLFKLTNRQKRNIRIADKNLGQIFTMFNGGIKTKAGPRFQPGGDINSWIEFCELIAKNVYGPEAEVELREHLTKNESLKKIEPENIKNAIKLQFNSILDLYNIQSTKRPQIRIQNKSLLEIFRIFNGSFRTQEGDVFQVGTVDSWIEFCKLIAKNVYGPEAEVELREHLTKSESLKKIEHENIKNVMKLQIKLQFNSILDLYNTKSTERATTKVGDKSLFQIFTMFNGSFKTKNGKTFKPSDTSIWIEFCELIAKNVYGPEAEVELREHLMKDKPQSIVNDIREEFNLILDLYNIKPTDRAQIRIAGKSLGKIFKKLNGTSKTKSGKTFQVTSANAWTELCYLVAEKVYGEEAVKQLDDHLNKKRKE